MKIEKITNGGYHYAFKITDGTEVLKVYQPKCMCMSCGYLDIIVEDDEGKRSYELHSYDNGDQKLDDIINLVFKLSDIIGKHNV